MKNFNLKKAILRDFGKGWLGSLADKPAFSFNTQVVQGVGGDYIVGVLDGKLALLCADGAVIETAPLSEEGWRKMLARVVHCYDADNDAARQIGEEK